MILSGEKTEEYRDVKESMVSLLFDWKKTDVSRKRFVGILTFDKYSPACWSWVKNFDTITFSNGYAKDRDQFVIEYDSIDIDTGNEMWGAEEDKSYFVLQLGKIINQQIKVK